MYTNISIEEVKINYAKLNKDQIRFFEIILDELDKCCCEYIDKEKTKANITNEKCGPLLSLKIFPKEGDNEIDIAFDPKQMSVLFAGWHDNGIYEEWDKKDCGFDMLKLLQNLITGNIKIVEFRTNKKPYHWKSYIHKDGEWVVKSGVSNMWYNIFGRRTKSEIIFGKIN